MVNKGGKEMADAKRCDLCNGYYDIDDHEYGESTSVNFKNDRDQLPINFIGKKDLCPFCMHEFKTLVERLTKK